MENLLNVSEPWIPKSQVGMTVNGFLGTAGGLKELTGSVW